MVNLRNLLEENDHFDRIGFAVGEELFFKEHVAPDGLADWNKHSNNRIPYNKKYKQTVKGENGILYRAYQLIARWRRGVYVDQETFKKDREEVTGILYDLQPKDENGFVISGVFNRNAGRNSTETNYIEDTRLYESHDNIVMICALINIFELGDVFGSSLNDYYNKHGGTLNNNLKNGKWFWRWRSYRLPYDGGIYALTGGSIPKPLQVFWSCGQFVLYGIQNLIRRSPHVHHGGLCYARYISIKMSLERNEDVPSWMRTAWFLSILFYKQCYKQVTKKEGIQWFYSRKVNDYDDPMKPLWKGVVW